MFCIERSCCEIIATRPFVYTGKIVKSGFAAINNRCAGNAGKLLECGQQLTLLAGKGNFVDAFRTCRGFHQRGDTVTDVGCLQKLLGFFNSSCIPVYAASIFMRSGQFPLITSVCGQMLGFFRKRCHFILKFSAACLVSLLNF